MRCTPLSPFVTRIVDMLKLDIEGAELPVLRELESSGALARINRMAIEYHHDPKGAEHLSELLLILERSGYRYNVRAHVNTEAADGEFQDILIHAYRQP